MATTADIRNGLIIRFNHDLYQVIEFLHVKPGKGNAFVRTKLKNVTSGRVLENTFPSGAKLEEVRVERRKFQYLYPDGNDFVFMNNESFEQITIPEAQIEARQFLKEGMECDVLLQSDNEQVLLVELPNFVEVEVTYTEPAVRGDTVNNVMKNATIETGAIIKVPMFVDQGERIKVDTRTSEYVERVKG